MRDLKRVVPVSFASKLLGLLAIIFFAPTAVILGLVAGYFLMRQFLSGWIPSRWISSSPLDWLYGMGVEGSASNYFGFMLAGVPTYGAFSGLSWGLRRLRGQ
jgi:hypothetical protein